MAASSLEGEPQVREPSVPCARSTLLRGALAGLLWAVLTASSLPPFSVWFIGLFAPLPLVMLAWSTRRPWLASIGACIGSLPLWIYHQAWMADVSLAGVFPMIGYLALWTGASVIVLSKVRRAARWLGPAVLVPTAWIGLEFLRGEILFEGYAWFLAGHPMIESVPLSRIASVGGVYTVSWVVVSVSGVVMASRYGTASSRKQAWVVSGAVVAVIGAAVILDPVTRDERTVRVAALQTNVPQSNKVFPSREQLEADLQDLIGLMNTASEARPDLLVTPETVLQNAALDAEGANVIASLYGEGSNPFANELLTQQALVGIPMLVGCTTLDRPHEGTNKDGRRALQWEGVFNSVYLIDAGRATVPRYDKLRPTPFGETLPYVQSFPWLRDLVLRIGLGASGMDFGLTPGAGPVPLVVPTSGGDLSVSAPICFESSMAPTVRTLVNAARDAGTPTQLLCVMTNDGWFGSFDAGREMHLLQARWRCVEHATPMIRCANTGISAVISPEGRVVSSLDARQAGVLVGDIALAGGGTWYQRFGDMTGWLCAAGTMVLLVAGAIRKRFGGRTKTEEPGT